MRFANPSWRLTRKLIPLFVLIAWLMNVSVARAHPLGNFTINHYSRIEASPTELRIRYVLDYAEIPTFQETQTIDRNGDGAISDDERDAYLVARLPILVSRLSLRMDGRSLALKTESGAKLEFSPGQGGLDIMRISAWLTAPLVDLQGEQKFEYQDGNYAERLGWREIVVRGAEGMRVQDSDVPDHDETNELTAYPQDLLNNPLNQNSARFVLIQGAGNSPSQSSSVEVSNPITTGALGAFDRTRDEFSKLITTQGELSPSVLFVSFLAAMLLGALHSFSPGHGKAIVGAYLVGSRGTPKHALFLGLIVTATHTIGVYALGLVTLFLSAFILPEQLFPWLGFLSGALVGVIGIQLFVQRLRAARGTSPAHLHTSNQALDAGNGHVHNHHPSMNNGQSHDHKHVHEHHVALERNVANTHNAAHEHLHTVAGEEQHSHAHAAPHVHSHEGAHIVNAAHEHEHEHAHTHLHASLHEHSHVFHSEQDEREHARVHLVAVEVAEKPTWRSLASLGISGGLLPCPSALVVMLSAIALGRVAFGLFLIIGFSLGLAGVLVLTGLVLLYAGRFAGRLLHGAAGTTLFRYVPVLGAFVVASLGVGIALESLLQTSLFK